MGRDYFRSMEGQKIRSRKGLGFGENRRLEELADVSGKRPGREVDAIRNNLRSHSGSLLLDS